MTKLEKSIVYIICLIFALISILCFNHLDLEYISTWGVSLLEHIQYGNLHNYAIDLFEIDYGTNYNLFQNVNVALWCLPLYVISNCFKITIPMVIYQTCIKVVVAVLHLLCGRELYRIVKNWDLMKEKHLSQVLYIIVHLL